MMEQKYTERYCTKTAEGKYVGVAKEHTITTDTKVPKVGVLLVGIGGNNGTTTTAGLLANARKIKFDTKRGMVESNYFGSFSQCATAKVGVEEGPGGVMKDVWMPVKDIVPMVNPDNFLVHGWDINDADMYEACKRSQVLEPTLLVQIKEELTAIKPMPAAFNPAYVAANQEARTNNVIKGTNIEVIAQLRKDLSNFRAKVDKVIVLWTGNTEINTDPIVPNVAELEKMMTENLSMPGSLMYAYACVQENILFINGSPQNTVSPGLIEMAKAKGSQVAGSDFKTGQTRYKTMLGDMLIGAGLKVNSIISYNHLGNNDGLNLVDPRTFRSKEISKASCLDDVLGSNELMYPNKGKNHEIDHVVVIKYAPWVGDSKRAFDEYSSTIFMGGHNTIMTYNICEDSLLAAPIMIDLLVIGEMLTRIKVDGENLGPVLSYLSLFFKAPVTNHREYVIHSLSRQRQTLINLLKVAGGFPIDDETILANKF